MAPYAKYLLLVALALIPAGCRNIDTTDLLAGDAPPPDSAELAYALANKTWCTNNEAASLVLALVEGQDNTTAFQERLGALEARGIVQSQWNLQADQPVTAGTLGYMVTHALDIKGGLLYRLIPCRRYAYREAIDAGLLERGAEYQPLTGPEVVAVMHRAAAYHEDALAVCPSCGG